MTTDALEELAGLVLAEHKATDAALSRLVDAEDEAQRQHRERMAVIRKAHRTSLLILVANAIVGGFIGSALMLLYLH